MMKASKTYFRFVFTLWVGVVFLIIPTFFNEIDTPLTEDSNQLQNSIISTELAYYTWGGSDSDSAYDIAIDSSNNSYVVGHTNSFGLGDSDLCLVKFNSSGVEWNRTFGGIYRDIGTSIVLDSLDNIYITGYTKSFGAGGSDIWLLKINSTGDVEWNHTWGGIYDEFGWNVAIDSLNNAYVIGSTSSFGEGSSDMCLVKFNSSGVVWNYTWGGSEVDEGYGLSLDSLGNVYVVGNTESYGVGGKDIFLAKLNSTGVVWNRTWGCVYDNQATDVIFSPPGDLYVAGYYEQSPNCTISTGGTSSPTIGLIKFTSEGIYQWNSTWKEGYYAYSYGMVLDSSGNAYIAGYTLDYNYNDYDSVLIRFNSGGEADWYCTWGGNDTDISRGVTLGPNGTAFVTGYTYSYGAGKNDIYLLQFILDQCPDTLPEDTDVVIAGYDIFILMGIAFVVSTILIKRKQ